MLDLRNIEPYRTLGRPINPGYFPLNKESSLKKPTQIRQCLDFALYALGLIIWFNA
jgi:hypothetical protein